MFDAAPSVAGKPKQKPSQMFARLSIVCLAQHRLKNAHRNNLDSSRRRSLNLATDAWAVNAAVWLEMWGQIALSYRVDILGCLRAGKVSLSAEEADYFGYGIFPPSDLIIQAVSLKQNYFAVVIWATAMKEISQTPDYCLPHTTERYERMAHFTVVSSLL